jgi:hypothetical protein
MRWGSRHAGYVEGEEAARAFAISEIEKHGSFGRIECVDVEKRVLYYDVFPEMT